MIIIISLSKIFWQNRHACRCSSLTIREYDRNKRALIKRQFYNGARSPTRSLLITRYNCRPSAAPDNYVLPRGSKSSATFRDLRKQFRARTTCSLRHERSVTQSPIQKEQHLRRVYSGLPRAEIIFANGRSWMGTSPQSRYGPSIRRNTTQIRGRAFFSSEPRGGRAERARSRTGTGYKWKTRGGERRSGLGTQLSRHNASVIDPAVARKRRFNLSLVSGPAREPWHALPFHPRRRHPLANPRFHRGSINTNVRRASN